MIIERLPGVQALAPEEKWILIDELWSDLAKQTEQSPADPELVKQLEARLSEFESDPSKGSPLDEVLARLGERKDAWKS